MHRGEPELERFYPKIRRQSSWPLLIAATFALAFNLAFLAWTIAMFIALINSINGDCTIDVLPFPGVKDCRPS